MKQGRALVHRESPVEVQEAAYRLPYHWFPESRLALHERLEKQRIVFEMISQHALKAVEDYLDAGCGDGRWSVDIFNFLGRSPRTHGIDISDRAIGFARLIEPKISFEVGHAERLPYDDDSFDLVSAIEIIEHVVDHAESLVVSELARVLRPGGTLVMTTPTWNLRVPPHHFRHYSINRIRDLLAENGLVTIALRGQAISCNGWRRRLRHYSNRFPVIWRFWRFTYNECSPERALDLLIAARLGEL